MTIVNDRNPWNQPAPSQLKPILIMLMAKEPPDHEAWFISARYFNEQFVFAIFKSKI